MSYLLFTDQADYQQQQNSGSPNRGFVPQQQPSAQQRGGPKRRMRRPYNSRF